MKTTATITVRLWLEKAPVYRLIGTARQFCSGAGFWGTTHPGALPRRVPDKSIRNPARAVAETQGWPANRGQCSSRVIEVFPPVVAVTSLSSTVVFAPAHRSNFLGYPSQCITVAGGERESVFTLTQYLLEFVWKGCRTVTGMNRKANATGYAVCEDGVMGHSQDEAVFRAGVDFIFTFFERFGLLLRISK
jgi:hypothetical protein